MSSIDFVQKIKTIVKSKFPRHFHYAKKQKNKLFRKTPIKKKNYHPDFEAYQVKALTPPNENRNKVLHLVANFWTGGSSRLVVDLIEHLGHLYDQKVLTRDIPDRPAYSGFKIAVNDSLESREFVLGELKRFNPDIVHVHYLGHHKDKWGIEDWKWYDNAFKALEQYNCPVVENINIPTEPYESKLVSHYVYVSNYVLEKFSKPNHNNTVVYPGSDFTHFERPDISDIPENCIGMVYRLERDKINENSIDVFIEVLKQRKGTKALIVGGGILLECYREKVSEAGLTDSFIFTGYVAYNDLPQYYKKMSVFIAPIHTESFGQVTPMAMNMGIPVAGYSAGALPEIIGDETMLAAPGDAKQLAKVVLDLLDDRERLLKTGRNNHNRAKALFSVETMIHSYGNIYKEIIDAKDRD